MKSSLDVHLLYERSPKKPLSLHVLLLSMFVALYLFESGQQWQHFEVIFGDKDIHSLLCVTREKMGIFFLNMCFTLQSNSFDSIPKCVVYIHFCRGTKVNGCLDY